MKHIESTMYHFRLHAALLAAVLVALLMAGSAVAQGIATPASRVFTLSAARDGEGILSVSIGVEDGSYLYRDSLEARVDGRGMALETPPGVEKDDPNFGLVEIYRGAVGLRLEAAPENGQLSLRMQGCSDAGICYPPVFKTLDLQTLAVGDAAMRSGATVTNFEAFVPSGANAAPAAMPATERGDAAAAMDQSLVVMLAGFLGFGLLLSLTPCIFPMIPILSAMLSGAGGHLTALRGFALSLAYVLAMALAYGVVGVAAGWSGANLQALMQAPWVLGLAALAFTGLALSQFGFYEISLPAGLAGRFTRREGGSLAGAAMLGFGSALIVGPCVTPPLAAAMLYAVKTGDALRGGSALFALGLGMGLPLLAVGLFGAKILPKSGPWLAAVRKVFGVVFLGVAVMLVARLLPGPAALALWGVFILGIAVFAGGFDRLEAASAASRRLGKAAGLAAAVYGGTMIVGAAGGADDPLRPLAFLSGAAPVAAERAALRVTSLDALRQAVAERSAAGPVLVSFTADWCTVCKSNDRIMERADIGARLARLSAISADVTVQGESERALMSRYEVVGPPVLLLLDSEGREIPGSRLVGPVTAEDVARQLDRAGA